MIVLVKGNTKPDLLLALKRGGVAVDVTNATVTFKLKRPSGEILSKTMAVIDGPKGKVACSWQADDLSESGDHLGEVQVNFGAGAVQNSKYALQLYVRDEFQENIG